MNLLLGDCLEKLKEIPDASIDALVTDPPYGTASKTKIQKQGSNNLNAFAIEWDQDLPLEWLKQARPKLVDGGAFLIFTDNRMITTLWDELVDTGYKPLQTFYWVKKNPPPQPRKNFCSAVETAIFGRVDGKINYWGGGGHSPNCFSAPIVGGDERSDHPTQKPISLMAHLVRVLTPPNGTVLDPFMGSGTTGVAAVKGGFDFVGIEQHPPFFQIAKTRIEYANNGQMTLL